MFKNLFNIESLLRLRFVFSSRNIPVCETRVIRAGKGYPWEGRIAIHPLGDGKHELTPIPPSSD